MQKAKTYRAELEKYSETRKKLQRKKTFFGIMRFGSILILIALFYFLWSSGPVFVIVGAAILLIIFVQLIYRDLDNRNAIDHLTNLILINEEELKAINGEYFHFGEGKEYEVYDHPYANDMDILGHASLFQFLNRTTSEMGARRLADWLLAPAGKIEIENRQAAITELKEKLQWRQQFQALGKETSIREATVRKLQTWLGAKTSFIQFRHWQWLRYILPLIILAVVTAYAFGLVDISTLLFFLLVYAVIAYQINKVIAPLHEQLSKMVDELDTLSMSIALIEKEAFQAPYLSVLQANVINDNKKASGTIGQLKKILDRLDIRYNIVLSAPLNLLLLWNLQQVLDLEKWKKNHAADVDSWFHTIGIMEALNSLATIHFNNPGWAFPTIAEQHFVMVSTGLGHPLINEGKRVNNGIKIDNSGEIMIVTGSNMAGKSTYLRSIGINIVLAMCGAPACAETFILSPVQLLSSMRIQDNLEESTSTFYAELKKLKTIIDKVNNKEKVFVLLDEILRGTNSKDRHTGSVALVKQLIMHNASAVIATHDLDLAELQKTYPANILNYHFDVQVKNDELFFDYKLKPGVCTSMNASILMKKIGIEL